LRFSDPLNRPVSIATIRKLAFHQSGNRINMIRSKIFTPRSIASAAVAGFLLSNISAVAGVVFTESFEAPVANGFADIHSDD
jgi:hypothetical protein